MPLHVSRNDVGVVTLRLDNPARRNALDVEMAAALRAAVASVREDLSVRCVVVTGTGTAFCSGADLGGVIESGRSDVLSRRVERAAADHTLLDLVARASRTGGRGHRA